MNASQPEADTEYSTPVGGSSPLNGPPGAARGRRFPRAFATARGLGLGGAGLLAAAEFSPLLRVRTIAAHPRLVRTVQGGPHHGWALLVIAALAGLISLLAARLGARPAGSLLLLLAVGALAVMLGVDLPDAHATGLVRIAGAGPTEAQAHAGLALYLETLGALALLLAGAVALLLNPQTPQERQAGEGETRGLPTARDRGLR